MEEKKLKKIYTKPSICQVNNVQGIVPLAAAAAGIASVASQIAPAAALVGGYAVGRGIKQAMESRPDQFCNRLISVIE